MKHKRILATAMILMLAFGAFAAPVYAASFSLGGSSSVTAGSTITVNLTLGSSSYGAEGTLSWDSSKLTYVSSRAVSGWTATFSSSTKRFTAYRPDGGAASGTFLSVTFRAKTGTSGTTTVKASSVKISTSGGEQSTSASKTITIKEPAEPVVLSSDATLKSLTVAEGTLSPAFAPGTTAYDLSVPSTTEKLTINAVKNNTKASVDVGSYTLTQGDTVPVRIVVTAENGDTKTYTINVTRELPGDYVPSDNALLSSLVPSVGTLSPAFDSGIFHYAMDVPYESTKMTFTAKTAFSRAKYNVLGESDLKPGANNVFYVVVMAEDGKTSQVYTITVRRSAVYSLYLQDAYVNEIIAEISQQAEPVVLDLAAAPVQVVDSDILTALKEHPDRLLIIRCIGARISLKGSDLTGEIQEGFYDFTINPSSRYEEGMLSKGSDGQSVVFSTHHEGAWPGTVEYAVDTAFPTGTHVNVYRYDPQEDQYITISEGIAVMGGTVVFAANEGGDFLLTTATLEDAVNSGNTPEQPAAPPETSLLYMILGGLSLFVLGILTGILGYRFLRRRARRKA